MSRGEESAYDDGEIPTSVALTTQRSSRDHTVICASTGACTRTVAAGPGGFLFYYFIFFRPLFEKVLCRTSILYKYFVRV